VKFREALGHVIRLRRLSESLTLRDVATRGNVSLGHLSDVERGCKEVSSEILEAIAFGLSSEVSILVLETALFMGAVPNDVSDLTEELVVS
jgi:transcriptional regulator with XRE-family HTH domain